MHLTQTKKRLIQFLKICKLHEADIISSVLMLETDDKAQALIDWITQNQLATTSEILQQAVLISEE